MTRKRKPKRTLAKISDSVAIGANLGFAEYITNLHATIEAIRAAQDGIQIRVSKVLLHLRTTSLEAFAIQMLAIQTGGTFTDNPNETEGDVGSMLEGNIDDVFGYDYLSPSYKVARKGPSTDGAAAATFLIEATFPIPNKLLMLLNKETETERLQDLLVGFIGHGSNGDTVFYKCFIEFHYVEEQRDIVIR
jgi:hypothetical protein